MECVDFNDVHNKQFVASSIKTYLKILKNMTYIDFIKETLFL